MPGEIPEGPNPSVEFSFDKHAQPSGLKDKIAMSPEKPQSLRDRIHSYGEPSQPQSEQKQAGDLSTFESAFEAWSDSDNKDKTASDAVKQMGGELRDMNVVSQAEVEAKAILNKGGVMSQELMAQIEETIKEKVPQYAQTERLHGGAAAVVASLVARENLEKQLASEPNKASQIEQTLKERHSWYGPNEEVEQENVSGEDLNTFKGALEAWKNSGFKNSEAQEAMRRMKTRAEELGINKGVDRVIELAKEKTDNPEEIAEILEQSGDGFEKIIKKQVDSYRDGKDQHLHGIGKELLFLEARKFRGEEEVKAEDLGQGGGGTPTEERPNPKDEGDFKQRIGTEITDSRLKLIVDTLNPLRSSPSALKTLEKQLEMLYERQTQGVYNEKEFVIVATHLQEWIDDISSKEKEFQSQAVTPQKIEVQVTGGGQEKRRLHEGAEYDKYLRDERWNNSEAPDYRVEKEVPEFYALKTGEEQEVFDFRLEISRAAYYKRNKSSDLKTYSDLERNLAMKGISTAEIGRLYDEEGLPGYRYSLEHWVHLVDNPDSFTITREIRKNDGTVEQKQISFLECGNKREADKFRRFVQNQIKKDILNENRSRWIAEGLTEEQIDSEAEKLAVDAEQTGFNTCYIYNVFESLARPQWESQERQKGKTLAANEFVHNTIGQAMSPLDTFIDKALRGDPSFGRSAAWAIFQLKAARVTENSFDTIKILSADLVEDQKRFWTVEGRVLLVPEIYPTKTIGSMFETFKVNDRPIIDYLRKRERVPWENISGSTSGVSDRYMRVAGKAGILSDYNTGKTPLQIEQKAREPWTKDIVAAVSMPELRHLDTPERRRWIGYESGAGIKEKVREPRMQGNYVTKKALDIAMKNNRFIPFGIFFRGDSSGSMLR